METLIAFLVLISIGAYLVARHLSAAIKAIRSKEWPTVEGNITESYVGSSGLDENNKETYEPVVQYKYIVGGSKFVGKKISWNTRTAQKNERVQTQIKQYPAGGTVSVYYNPDDPWEAVLKPEASDSLKWIVTGLASVIIGFSIAISCAWGYWCPGVGLVEALLQFGG